MRQMIFILFLFSLGSTWAISFALGHCIFIYTGSMVYQLMFQLGCSFLSSLYVSQFIIEKYVKPMFGM